MPREHGDCMFRNEWLHKFKPMLGTLGMGTLPWDNDVKLPDPIARLAYKAVPKDASRRQHYNGASLYLRYFVVPCVCCVSTLVIFTKRLSDANLEFFATSASGKMIF